MMHGKHRKQDGGIRPSRRGACPGALRKSEARLQLIARITGTVVGTTPLSEQARELADQVREAFAVDACVIRTLEGEDLVLLASSGIPEPKLSPRIPARCGISQEILERRRPIFITDVRTHPTTSPWIGRLPNPYRFISYAGAPLMVEDRIIGIVGIYTVEQLRRFSHTDLAHLQLVADHIALAILNDRLYKEVRTQKEQMEAEIAARRRLEEQLLHSVKMESIGRLAGGIAHEFNNLLTVILGYTELATDTLVNDDPMKNHLQHIEKAGKRAADLVRQLLAFARRQTISPGIVNLNCHLREIDTMLRPLIGEDVQLIIHPAIDLWTVRIDPGEFQQVLVNLAVNARDAMPHGGALTIETTNLTIHEGVFPHCSEVPPGEYVRVSVSDTGEGMPEEVQQRIFEPFFTTKEVGKGTGMGLAICYGIVRRSGGYIRVDSEPGRGTTLSIYLPRAQEDTPHLPIQEERREPCGTETVLVVEDEPQIAKMAAYTLQVYGYNVLTSYNGVDALRVAEQYEGDIDLLLTDVVMPRMSGKELADRLRAVRPRIKVLFTSGYAKPSVIQNGVRREENFLPKPYDTLRLARKVREVLDARVV